jgi:truncated hemoglobin YjbI
MHACMLALFGAGRPDHVDHLTAFTAETFGGPDRFSRELGFAHLISVHRGLRITEEQRQRFVELYMAALDATEMPCEPAFREAVREHIEFGSQVAMQNSQAGRRRGRLMPCSRSCSCAGALCSPQHESAALCAMTTKSEPC